jgi:hypothetical protein
VTVVTGDWPSSSDIEILCKKAAGFFIYASTVVKFVDSELDPPSEDLPSSPPFHKVPLLKKEVWS